MHHPNPDIIIAPMCGETVQAVSHLEKECFSEPWSLDGLLAELSNPIAVFYTAQMGTDGKPGEVAGYAGMHHVVDEGYMANVAVSAKYRRMGVASALLHALFDYGHKNSLKMITLEVRPSNVQAIAMYEKFGFHQEGRRKSFYHHPTEDALILTARLS